MKYLMITTVLLMLLTGCSKNAAPTPEESAAPVQPIQQAQLSTPAPPMPTETEEPIPTSNPDPDKSADQVKEMIINVANAAAEYVGKYQNQTQFVSKNGYLAESSGDIYVKPESLLDVTVLKPEYSGESVLILYIIPDDIKDYMEVADGLMPTVFAAYEMEDVFAVASVGDANIASQYCEIKKDKFQQLIARYSWDHGTVNRINSGTDTHSAIYKALSDETKEQNLDVRYLSSDDKYASAVVSPKGEPLNILEYVLEQKDGMWTVVVPMVEKTNWKFNAVNKAFPDMNLAIMPKYQLVDSLKYLKGDFQPIVDAMLKENLIDSNDGEPDFISGNNEFVYIEFNTDKRFLGHFDEDIMTWVMYPSGSYDETTSLMKRLAKFIHPTYYLIRQY